jgi:thiol-disulfide isomerase/thioredoxin
MVKANQLALAALRASAVDDAVQDLAPGPAEGWSPSLDGATGWLNSPPLSAAGLRGQVILVNFWTYTCINWLRTLPFVRAWERKYRDPGLVVVGVHSPEFAFERHEDNVRRAVRRLDIDYPVAIDSNHAIWRSFANQYWPAVYLIDAHGEFRHHQFGEGEYAQTEMAIQRLLAEAGLAGHSDLVTAEADGVQAAADWANLGSLENYLGYGRTENFASPGDLQTDGPAVYLVPDRLRLNQWALDGTWTASRDAIVAEDADAAIAYQFHARDLHLVMGPAARGATVPFRVRLDGDPPGSAHGLDIDEQGRGSVSEQRLYQLIRQPGPIADRQFVIEFAEPGVAAYAFTFG